MTTHAVRPLAVGAGFGAAAATAALIGVLAVTDTSSQYAGLEQPAWAPPSWLFGPVWTVLYVTIAVSGWLVWRRTGWSWQLVPYGVQLVLNALWTPLFFGAGLRGTALVDIVLLWLAIGTTIWAFRLVRPAAAWLLLPYWLWTTFATALNAAIWAMNR
ncbi:tryptophan-rich sensory protein [Kribbella sandramycini]|uniref:Tryptophan-rich sensory protein n=1 Tax=Kribbella sandramycini TaxID=60450 RepID=A0A7Y4P3E1_9ACTN|nr:TspO/MBR family protein [Kribbella sandramycini]MBB6570297.1 tryptophan-rich sensory protein [Kribbella sandramycini]NOL45786.1 tryptophan-rich sensory protein [Kribbella sandramycini]